MKSTVERIEECKARLTLEFETQEAQKAYGQVLRNIAKEVKIDGFPKGKVPAHIIEDRVSKEYIQQDAVNKLLQEHGEKSIEENKLELLNPPSFDSSNMDFDGTLTISLNLELSPEINLPNYKGLKISIPQIDLGKELNVDKELELLSRQFAAPEKIENENIQEFDIVKMDCIAAATDGTDMSSTDLRDHVTEVVEERLAPGILPQLLTMKSGETKQMKVNFPADYDVVEFAGKEVEYTVTIHTVSRRTPLPINDELAQKAGYETLDALKENITKDFTNTVEQFNNNRKKIFTLDKIVSEAKINMPEWLIDRAAQSEAHSRHHAEEHTHGEQCDHGEIKPTEEDKTIAVSKLQNTLIMRKLGKDGNVEISQQELYNAVMQYQQILSMMQANGQLTQDIIEMIREQISIDKVLMTIVEGNEYELREEKAEDKAVLNSLSEKYAQFRMPLYPNAPLR